MMDSQRANEQQDGVIDCDLHNELPSLETLYPYLPDHWRAYAEESAFVGPDANDYPAGAATTARQGSRPADGRPPGAEDEQPNQRAGQSNDRTCRIGRLPQR